LSHDSRKEEILRNSGIFDGDRQPKQIGLTRTIFFALLRFSRLVLGIRNIPEAKPKNAPIEAAQRKTHKDTDNFLSR
jgi:hypothetical protein